jgi:hypothetical protein
LKILENIELAVKAALPATKILKENLVDKDLLPKEKLTTYST